MYSVYVDLYNQKPMSWRDTNCHPTWFTLAASLNLQIGSKDLLLLAIWVSLFLAQLIDSLLIFWLVYHKLVFVLVIWFSLAILYWCLLIWAPELWDCHPRVFWYRGVWHINGRIQLQVWPVSRLVFLLIGLILKQ